jgi:hypothetical protein
LNDEAAQMSTTLHVKLIVDRGFRDNRQEFLETRAGSFPNLKFTFEIAKHLGTEPNIVYNQHSEEEVLINRQVQARRWANEKAFKYFNNARFFNRKILMSTLHNIEFYQKIGFAYANKSMKVPINSV